MSRPHPWDNVAQDVDAHHARRHPWELHSEHNSEHAWEHVSEQASSDDEDAETDPHKSPRAAEQAFVERLTSMYMASSISAENVCVMCYFLGLAGLSDNVKSFGKRPGLSSSHYSEHLRLVLGLEDQRSNLYIVNVPGHERHAFSRKSIKLNTFPLHENYADDIEQDPTFRVRLHESRISNKLPPSYWEHPLVKSHPDKLIGAVAIYMDGVRYSNSDTVVGIWLVCVVTGRRHLVALVRKRNLCDCGCKGWCTWFTILSYIRWCCECLHEGVMPSQRHDCSEWLGQDSVRAQRAGKAFTPAIVLYLKGDWMEFCERFGFFGQGHSLRTCFLCNAHRYNLYEAAGSSILALPFHCNTHDSWDAACTSCEIVVALGPEHHRQLKMILQFDKREKGSHGLALRQPFHALQLAEGDRVEPSSLMPDVFEILEARVLDYPMFVLFWRPSNEYMCHHRCPLFSKQLRITCDDSIAIDTLHTFYLGPLHGFSILLLWSLFAARSWGPFNCNSAAELINACRAARHNLTAFIKQRRVLVPQETLTALSDLTCNMVGTANSPQLKVKAAETWTVFLWLRSVLLQPAVFERVHLGSQLLEAANCLHDIIRVWKEQPSVMSARALQLTMTRYVRYLDIISSHEDLHACRTPKTHMVLHMIARAHCQGNPMDYSTFYDESLNKELKKILRNVHQLRFDDIGLVKMAAHLVRIGPPQKRRRIDLPS